MKKSNLLARKRNPKTTKINFTTEITVYNSYSALEFTERPTPVPEEFKFEPIFFALACSLPSKVLLFYQLC